MPMLASSNERLACLSPASTSACRCSASVWSVSLTRTGEVLKRCTSRTLSSPGPTRPTMTRPADAPRSAAATVTLLRLPQEGSGYTPVHRDEQAGGERQIAAAQRDYGSCDVLWQHLALEQRPLCVERAQLGFRHPVD